MRQEARLSMLEKTSAATRPTTDVDTVRRALRTLDAGGSSTDQWHQQSIDFIQPLPLIDGALRHRHDWVLWKGVDGRVRLGLGKADKTIHQRFSTAADQYRQSDRTPPFVFFGGRFDVERSATPSPWSAWGTVEAYAPLIVFEWRSLESNLVDVTVHRDSLASCISLVHTLVEHDRSLPEETTEIRWTPAESKKAWCERVRQLQQSFQPNGLEKVVMARQVESDEAIPIARVIHAVHRLLSEGSNETVFVFGRETGIFMGSSPETLVNLQAGTLRTHALAGTSTDRQDANQLQHDEKIRREHEAVIRHLESKLSAIATELAVDKTRLRHSRALLHLETRVGAKIDGKHLLDLVAHLHPTPALGGAPVDAANAWLRANESLDRGWFGGPIGWFSSKGDGQCAVAIRCALLLDSGAHAYAGAGIVRGSDPNEEWRETRAKLASILDAFKACDA